MVSRKRYCVTNRRETSSLQFDLEGVEGSLQKMNLVCVEDGVYQFQGSGPVGGHRMLFTIILEFEGTTSVSQFSGRSVHEAYRSWFRGLKDAGRFGLNVKQAERLSAALSFEGLQPPTPLASTKNVWCTSTHVDESLALVNFVSTVAATSSRAKRITAVTTSNELGDWCKSV